MDKSKRIIRTYALYKGDKFIDMGTLDYLADLLGVKPKTILFYTTPSYQKRVRENSYIVIKVDEKEA